MEIWSLVTLGTKTDYRELILSFLLTRCFNTSLPVTQGHYGKDTLEFSEMRHVDALFQSDEAIHSPIQDIMIGGSFGWTDAS